MTLNNMPLRAAHCALSFGGSQREGRMKNWQTRVLLTVSSVCTFGLFGSACAISSPHWDYVPESISEPIHFKPGQRLRAIPWCSSAPTIRVRTGWPTAGEASYVT